MRVNGEEFVKNLKLEQEKQELAKQQEIIDKQKKASVVFEDDLKQSQSQQQSQQQSPQDKSEEPFINLSSNATSEDDKPQFNIDDFNDLPSATNNKRKYIFLGIGLIVLFIATIVIIRIVSNNDVEQQLEKQPPIQTEVVKDELLTKIEKNELKQQQIQEQQTPVESGNSDDLQDRQKVTEVALPQQSTQNDVPLVIDTPKPKTLPKRDLFGLENGNQAKQNTQPKQQKKVAKQKRQKIQRPKPASQQPIIQKNIKRKTIVPPPQETNFTVKNSKVSGYYIQIGAFTKSPTQRLLNSITQKGYKGIVHKMMIKGRLYNKILIGSYKSRTQAKRVLEKVRRDFNNPNAYILKF